MKLLVDTYLLPQDIVNENLISETTFFRQYNRQQEIKSLPLLLTAATVVKI